ncbi:DUF2267 domain-containing protein [Methylocapsa polymorpha]|uniref:DUF2267 domain-containing protein n=1 Tax=Methylocapsa polymorpha TaxID=3080828 RepID=A0ABZ0HSE7_9HYPH|nr:DUF2267 domain-containing protein [Methylocapsa sp. RX1]
MAIRSLQELDNVLRETTEWVDDLTLRLGWRDRNKAYSALIAALHALRDWLPREEAIYIGGCLPRLLRGLYYEGWHAARHAPTKNRQAFLERIHDGVHREPGIDPEQVARAVFALLAARLPPAELENAKAVTPKDLHGLWPS